MTTVNTVTADYTHLQPLEIIYIQTRCNLLRISNMNSQLFACARH